MSSAEQLGLPFALDGESSSAGFVATFLWVPVERVHAAIETGELPAWHDGQRWQVPLWAIPAFARSVGERRAATRPVHR